MGRSNTPMSLQPEGRNEHTAQSRGKLEADPRCIRHGGLYPSRTGTENKGMREIAVNPGLHQRAGVSSQQAGARDEHHDVRRFSATDNGLPQAKSICGNVRTANSLRDLRGDEKKVVSWAFNSSLDSIRAMQ
jgi:hypothetical protein